MSVLDIDDGGETTESDGPSPMQLNNSDTPTKKTENPDFTTPKSNNILIQNPKSVQAEGDSSEKNNGKASVRIKADSVIIEPVEGAIANNGYDLTEFRANHYIPATRCKSFEQSFSDESITLTQWGSRTNAKGNKEICGKAKCAACVSFTKKQGIHISIGFSGHGSIVRNEFRDQIRKHRQTKKHIKALEIWKSHQSEDNTQK
eukprot:UN28853